MLRWIAEASRRLGVARPAYHVLEFVRSINPRGAQRDRAFLAGAAPLKIPLPPASLRVQVAGTPDAQWFLQAGAAFARTIRELAAAQGVRLEQTRAILEFGCGCGRVLRHLADLRGPEVHGVDYNPRLVDWCRANLGFARFALNQAEPPLPYADAMFDLVYSISVFTHLAEPLQAVWMAELRRIVRPGGLVLITTMGESFIDKLTDAEQARFRAGQLVVQFDEASGLNLCGAYHPRAYVEHELAAGFDLLDRLPFGSREHLFQDVYLLRKH